MTKPLALPSDADGEVVDRCDYSRTGWAIWRPAIKGGGCGFYCTCQPAKIPRGHRRCHGDSLPAPACEPVEAEVGA